MNFGGFGGFAPFGFGFGVPFGFGVGPWGTFAGNTFGFVPNATVATTPIWW